MREPKVYLKKLNWDHEYETDFLCDRGIHVTDMPFNKEVKNINGSHSPLFHSD